VGRREVPSGGRSVQVEYEEPAAEASCPTRTYISEATERILEGRLQGGLPE
jgi:hypothetical protein